MIPAPRDLFLLVANPRNWKLPVNAEVPVDESVVPAIVSAIKQYTGDAEVAVTKTERGFRFTSDGFYNIHGDPIDIP